MDPLPTPSQSPPPPLKQSKSKLSPLYQIVLPNRHNLTPDSLLYTTKTKSREQPILRQPRKTNPIVWFAAILCMLFSILVIVLGIATLIVYLAVQPKSPSFDTIAASVRSIYFNPPEFINGDVAFLVNVSNPNRRLNVKFEHMRIDLYFSESLMASQVVMPFSERPGEARLVSTRLLVKALYLPPNVAMELQRQAVGNRIVYDVQVGLRVKFKTGLVHYSKWMRAECRLEMTSPPNSVLITHSCTIKK